MPTNYSQARKITLHAPGTSSRHASKKNSTNAKLLLLIFLISAGITISGYMLHMHANNRNENTTTIKKHALEKAERVPGKTVQKPHAPIPVITFKKFTLFFTPNHGAVSDFTLRVEFEKDGAHADTFFLLTLCIHGGHYFSDDVHKAEVLRDDAGQIYSYEILYPAEVVLAFLDSVGAHEQSEEVFVLEYYGIHNGRLGRVRIKTKLVFAFTLEPVVNEALEVQVRCAGSRVFFALVDRSFDAGDHRLLFYVRDGQCGVSALGLDLVRADEGGFGYGFGFCDGALNAYRTCSMWQAVLQSRDALSLVRCTSANNHYRLHRHCVSVVNPGQAADLLKYVVSESERLSMRFEEFRENKMRRIEGLCEKIARVFDLI